MTIMRLFLLWKLSKRRRRRRITHVKSHKLKVFHPSKYQFLLGFAKNYQVPSWGEKYFILLSTSNSSYLGFARNYQVPSWGEKYVILLITNSSYLGFARNYQVPSWGEKYVILLSTNSSYLGFARNYQVPSWGEIFYARLVSQHPQILLTIPKIKSKL